MRDEDLKKTLSAFSPPAVDPAARERALHRSSVALAQPQAATERPPRALWHRSMWRVALLACVVVGVIGTLAIRQRVNRAEASMTASRADAVTLAQMQALFPGQLNAVIEQDGEVRLDLASVRGSDASEQPVILQLEKGGHRLRVLSYSGRLITLELKGARLTFEALVTSDGGIILSGDNFAWSSAQPQQLAGYRVEARALSAL